jgi:predicted dehydrogenase
MKKGKAVMVHKPLANRLREARRVIETARQTKVPTHFIPASASENIRAVAEWIRAGHLGALREVHNWSNRPVWTQYPVIPQDTPPVPDGFDWDLWLGPSQPRPYHPHYTNAVFRGWFEFGGGAVADMGHYSLWPVFAEFGLDAPVWVESTPSHLCAIHDHVSVKIHNDYAFPAACTIRFRFAAKGTRPGLDIFWYDGGIRPPTPDELAEDHRELPAEGMMFVCEKGRILAGFLGETPAVIPPSKNREFQEATRQLKPSPRKSSAWVQAFQGGEPTVGNFLLAGPISEAFNLGAISLRLGGKRLVWDSANMKITNPPEANAFLTRDYRPGWEI